MFYADIQNRYRYWLKKVNGLTVIKLQMTAKRLAILRKNPEIARTELLVDVLGCGGGWYEISTKEDNYLDRRFKIRTDGAAVWLRLLNKMMLGNINANPTAASVAYVKRIDFNAIPARVAQKPTQGKLHQLVRKFSHRPAHTMQRSYAGFYS